MSKLPHPIEQRLMGVTLQIQRVETLKCDGRRRRVQLAVLRVAAECLDDLDIRQVRHV